MGNKLLVFCFQRKLRDRTREHRRSRLVARVIEGVSPCSPP